MRMEAGSTIASAIPPRTATEFGVDRKSIPLRYHFPGASVRASASHWGVLLFRSGPLSPAYRGNMNRCMVVLCCALLSGYMGVAQNPSIHPGQNPNRALAPAPAVPDSQDSPSPAKQGSVDQRVIHVELTKSLDAKRLKQGDPVKAKTTEEVRAGDGTIIPIGSTVQGHITRAAARSKGEPQSSIGIAFDSVVLKDGKQLPLKVTIQAVGAPAPLNANNPMYGDNGIPHPPLAGGSPMGGTNPAGGFPQGPSGPPQTTAGQPDTLNSPTLTDGSAGVVGLRNLDLQPNSILTSSGKDLKLDAGTEMVLRVQDQ